MEQGFNFSCIRCHRCCRHQPGYVFLTKNDIPRLVEYLACPVEQFLNRYTRLIYSAIGRRYSLREQSNYDCIFWDDGCQVYAARPAQCRSYPFWQRIVIDEVSWQAEAKNCPGIGQGRKYSAEQVQKIATGLAAEVPYILGGEGED